MTITAQPQAGSVPSAPGGAGGASRIGPDPNFSRDPFIRRVANPASAERDRRSRRDLVDGLALLTEQRTKAEIADDMYNGDVGMVYASDNVRKLLVKQGVSEDEIEDFNYAKIPVDTIADALQIAAVKVAPVTDGDDEEDGKDSADKATIKKAKKKIKELRKVNQLDVWEQALHKNVSTHGDAFLFLWPVQDERGRVVSVDMRVNTAHNVCFVYDQEDPLRPAYVIKSWETASDFEEDGAPVGGNRKMVVRANLYYPGPLTIDADGQVAEGVGRVERWVTEPGANPRKTDSWKRVHQAVDIEPDDVEYVAADEFGDADEPFDRDDIPSPFGLTWFHFRNNVPCGIPEHVSAYGPQKLINKLIWTFAGNIDYLGFPQRYIMVDPKIDDPMVNVVDPDHPDDLEDDPEGDGATSGLRSDPGVVWRLFGKSTGQYSAADPDTLLRPLDRFITAMSELTGLPRYAFTKSSTDLPSGEAARELKSSETKKVKNRQDRYDSTWQDAYELALRMFGITGVAVDVRWVPADSINDLNGLNVLKAKRELGVPNEVLLNEAGYPDDQVQEWLADLNGADFAQRVAMLVQIGTAVQTMGAGVTLGVVSEPQMQALITRLLGNLMQGTADPEPGPDALPTGDFREPPPVNPAMAAVEAGKADPLRQAQVKATHATAESSLASAESSRASADMLRSGAMAQPGQPGGQPAKKTARPAGPARPGRPNGGSR